MYLTKGLGKLTFIKIFIFYIDCWSTDTIIAQIIETLAAILIMSNIWIHKFSTILLFVFDHLHIEDLLVVS